jgi:hypothetical protein
VITTAGVKNEQALKETGNEGRPLSDWSVKWNNQVLDMNKKIGADGRLFPHVRKSLFVVRKNFPTLSTSIH